MNDIGEKGWSSVSTQVVLGRGTELGPARFRSVVSLGFEARVCAESHA